MPQIGEIKKGNKRPLNDRASRIYHACEDCGKARWVLLIRGQPRNLHCRQCARIRFGLSERGSNHSQWKNGKVQTSDGYVAVYVPGDDLFFSMVGGKRKFGGYVLEHRLIYAEHLGRCLRSYEIVHHKNGDKMDNRLDNLKLTTRKEHMQVYKSAYQDGYQQGYADAQLRLREVSHTT